MRNLHVYFFSDLFVYSFIYAFQFPLTLKIETDKKFRTSFTPVLQIGKWTDTFFLLFYLKIACKMKPKEKM